MHLGRVIGTVVAERIYEGLEGSKLLLVEPVDEHLRAKAAQELLVAVDTVQAGLGDVIFYVSSREAALALEPWFVPVDHTVVGVVDSVHPEAADEDRRGRGL